MLKALNLPSVIQSSAAEWTGMDEGWRQHTCLGRDVSKEGEAGERACCQTPLGPNKPQASELKLQSGQQKGRKARLTPWPGWERGEGSLMLGGLRDAE